MIKTFNILSLLLDYPTQELRNSLEAVLPALKAEAVLSDAAMKQVAAFLAYAKGFSSLRDWQAAYSDLFDRQSKENLYLFDLVYGTQRDRGQAMVDLKEEYLRAGLMPHEDELPDYLPMYLQYVANMDPRPNGHEDLTDAYLSDARSAMADIQPVLTKMVALFDKNSNPYAPLLHALSSEKLKAEKLKAENRKLKN